MSTYFITVEQAENSEIFDNMETKNYNCSCGQSYAFYEETVSDGSINQDFYVVCDGCLDNYPRDRYF
jgi:hypothetical protein